jgi:hypothetical protein
MASHAPPNSAFLQGRFGAHQSAKLGFVPNTISPLAKKETA